MGLIGITHPGALRFLCPQHRHRHTSIALMHALMCFHKPRRSPQGFPPTDTLPSSLGLPCPRREEAGGVPEHRRLDGGLKGPGCVQV